MSVDPQLDCLFNLCTRVLTRREIPAWCRLEAPAKPKVHDKLLLVFTILGASFLPRHSYTASQCPLHFDKETYLNWTCKSIVDQTSRRGKRMQWKSYRNLSGLDKESAAKQIQALTLCFSRDTLSIVQNLGDSLKSRKAAWMRRYTLLSVTGTRHYIDGHINETVERRNFR